MKRSAVIWPGTDIPVRCKYSMEHRVAQPQTFLKDPGLLSLLCSGDLRLGGDHAPLDAREGLGKESLPKHLGTCPERSYK